MPVALHRRPNNEAASALALKYLGDARHAIAHPRHPEALHEFRVAIRRLRVILKAFPRVNRERVPNALIVSLKRLARATNLGRDNEVALAWIYKYRSAYRKKDDTQIRELANVINKEHHRHRERFARELIPRFRRIALRLAPILTVPVSNSTASTRRLQPFSVSLAEPLKHERRKLADRFRELKHTMRQTGSKAELSKQLHQVRITAKRFRYLIAPIERFSLDAELTLSQLTRLQSLLGKIHDRDAIIRLLQRKRAPMWLIAVAEAERKKLLKQFTKRLKHRIIQALMRTSKSTIAELRER